MVAARETLVLDIFGKYICGASGRLRFLETNLSILPKSNRRQFQLIIIEQSQPAFFTGQAGGGVGGANVTKRGKRSGPLKELAC